MGLDAVGIVLRAEELFAITTPDDEAASIRTVGAHLQQPLPPPLRQARPHPAPFPRHPHPPPAHHRRRNILPDLSQAHALPAPPDVPWSPQSVWDTLVALLADQQGLDPADILPTARFAEDLRVD